jgi:hypothetical protein
LEDLNAISSSASTFTDNTWKLFANLDFLCRILSGASDAVKVTDRLKLLQVWSQPQKIVRDAKSILQRLCTPFIYYDLLTTERGKEMLHHAFSESVVREVAETKRVLESELVAFAIDEILEVKDRLGIRWKGFKVRCVGTAAVVTVFMDWLDALLRCGEIAKSNRRRGHIYLAGCARVQLMRDSGDFFGALNRALSTSRSVNALHSLYRVPANPNVLQAISISSWDSTRLNIAAQLYSRVLCRCIDQSEDRIEWSSLQELQQAIFWQHSADNVLLSIAWDQCSAISKGRSILASHCDVIQYLHAVSDDGARYGIPPQLSPLLVQESAAWEHMLGTHEGASSTVIDYLSRCVCMMFLGFSAYRLITCPYVFYFGCRKKFLFGRDAFDRLVRRAILRLDVSTLIRLMLGGLSPLTDSELFWSAMINEVPSTFANLSFSRILKPFHLKSSASCASRAGSLFLDRGDAELDSVESRCQVIKEILFHCRDIARSRKGGKPKVCGIEIDGSLFVADMMQMSSNEISDDVSFFDRAASFGPRLVALRSAECIGASPLAGLVIQVTENALARRAFDVNSHGKGDSGWSLQAPDFSVVRRVLLLDGRWYEAHTDGMIQCGPRGSSLRHFSHVHSEAADMMGSLSMRKREVYSTGPCTWLGVADRYLCMPAAAYRDLGDVLLETKLPLIRLVIEEGSVEALKQVDSILRERFEISLYDVEIPMDRKEEHICGLKCAVQFGSDEVKLFFLNIFFTTHIWLRIRVCLIHYVINI